MKNAGYNIETIEITNMENDKEHGIALAQNEATGYWVTWQFTYDETKTDLNEKYSFYWGHYFEREKDARADYHRRLLAEYEN